MGNDSLIRRVGARAVMISPAGRILLMKLTEPGEGVTFWITPGGGLEPGESAPQGLLRELGEEVGRRDFDIGPVIWTRSNQFTWDGQPYHQDETYHLIVSDEFETGEGGAMDPEERIAFQGFRWWSFQEIQESNETFAPGRLGELLESLHLDGPPAEPFDTAS